MSGVNVGGCTVERLLAFPEKNILCLNLISASIYKCLIFFFCFHQFFIFLFSFSVFCLISFCYLFPFFFLFLLFWTPNQLPSSLVAALCSGAALLMPLCMHEKKDDLQIAKLPPQISSQMIEICRKIVQNWNQSRCLSWWKHMDCVWVTETGQGTNQERSNIQLVRNVLPQFYFILILKRCFTWKGNDDEFKC